MTTGPIQPKHADSKKRKYSKQDSEEKLSSKNIINFDKHSRSKNSAAMAKSTNTSAKKKVRAGGTVPPSDTKGNMIVDATSAKKSADKGSKKGKIHNSPDSKANLAVGSKKSKSLLSSATNGEAVVKIDIRNPDLMKELFPLTEEGVKMKIEEWRKTLGVTRRQASFLQKKYSVRRHTQEKRRLERIKEKVSKKVCFKCRESGHVLSECPQTDGDVDALANKCFKCGGMSHISKHCPQKNKKEYAFSKCFICSEMGHLARECPKNPKGAYPFGGACNLCGEVDHLIKDCPRSGIKEDGKEELTLKAGLTSGSADYEPPVASKPKKKKAKIVKF